MSEAVGVAPAQLSLEPNGVARSTRFDDVYHSTDGALAQAQHVFVRGNRLPERWRGCSSFTIIETGFGLGNNFVATWTELRAERGAVDRLDYIAVEQYPPQRAELERFYACSPHCPDLSRELIRRWPPLTRGFHRMEFDAGRVVLTLLLGDATAMLAELDAVADALYLDGFAPEKNPAMWSDALFAELARLSVKGTTAATWTVASDIRARLAAAGFRTVKRAGFGRKRAMLVGEKIGGVAAIRPQRAKHAVIVGAGLAGAWCAHALARRGWDVDLIERFSRPAQAASGNAVGAVRPALNLADNDNAQIARAAFLYAARSLATCSEIDDDVWSQTGVLHVATSAAHQERMARIDAAQAFPSDYVSLIDVGESCARVGHRVSGPGWWIPLGGWANPARLCEALLRLNHNRITCHFGQEAIAVDHRERTWRVIGRQDNVIASAATLVLAAGHEMSRLPGTTTLPLMRVRGQVTHLPPSAGRALEIVVCGDGYVAPLPAGGYCVGATFQPGDADVTVRSADHAENLARLDRMLPGFGAGHRTDALAGRAAVRTATADRLPACGGLPAAADRFAHPDGLFVLTGLGARGLIWAPLCADVLGAHLNHESNPLERRLIRALDPSRLLPGARSGSPLESSQDELSGRAI